MGGRLRGSGHRDDRRFRDRGQKRGRPSAAWRARRRFPSPSSRNASPRRGTGEPAAPEPPREAAVRAPRLESRRATGGGAGAARQREQAQGRIAAASPEFKKDKARLDEFAAEPEREKHMAAETERDAAAPPRLAKKNAAPPPQAAAAAQAPADSIAPKAAARASERAERRGGRRAVRRRRRPPRSTRGRTGGWRGIASRPRGAARRGRPGDASRAQLHPRRRRRGPRPAGRSREAGRGGAGGRVGRPEGGASLSSFAPLRAGRSPAAAPASHRVRAL